MGLLASASAVSVRSQTKSSGFVNTISDIGNFFEGIGEDIGDFFENDFVDFFEETIPNTAMSGIDWFETTGRPLEKHSSPLPSLVSVATWKVAGTCSPTLA